MALIAGASRFLNQSTLANTQGVSAQSTNVLSEAAGSVSILDIGRNLSGGDGIGISATARALNTQLVESNAAAANNLFSFTGGVSATIESAQTQINGLRSTVPASRDTPEVREAAAEVSSELGSVVDETV